MSTFLFNKIKGKSVMSRNDNLNIAYYEKRDEFYTQYEDIEKEIRYYKKHLKPHRLWQRLKR